MVIKPPSSRLFGTRWNLPRRGVALLRWPTFDDTRHIDRTWPDLRPEDAEHRGWKWSDIVSRRADRFVLVSEEESAPVAIWSSAHSSLVQLPDDGLCYRLDYLEVRPDLTEQAIGVYTFALAARRALELGGQGLVLGALPQAKAKYEAWGGEARLPRGWQVALGLAPFFFSHNVLQNLEELLDAVP